MKVKLSQTMKKKPKPAKPVPAEQIARMADKGKSVATFFKRRGCMVQANSAREL